MARMSGVCGIYLRYMSGVGVVCFLCDLCMAWAVHMGVVCVVYMECPWCVWYECVHLWCMCGVV